MRRCKFVITIYELIDTEMPFAVVIACISGLIVPRNSIGNDPHN